VLAGSSMNRNVRVRDPDVAEGQLRSMVEKCKEVLRSRDPRYLGSLLTLANFLRVQWRHGDAAAAAEELIWCAVELESEYSAQVWCHGMEVLAACRYGNFDDGLAEATLRQVIDVCSMRWGLARCVCPVSFDAIGEMACARARAGPGASGRGCIQKTYEAGARTRCNWVTWALLAERAQ
jgi:hypothetical protein